MFKVLKDSARVLIWLTVVGSTIILGCWALSRAVGVSAVTAQETASTAPTLTETQRLQFQVLFQAREIAQLKFEAATADIARLTIAVNVVPGYTFDLATLSFRPEPKKESSP